MILARRIMLSRYVNIFNSAVHCYSEHFKCHEEAYYI